MAIKQFTFGEGGHSRNTNDCFATLNPPYYVNTCQASLLRDLPAANELTEKQKTPSLGVFYGKYFLGYANSLKSTGTTREIPFSTMVIP